MERYRNFLVALGAILTIAFGLFYLNDWINSSLPLGASSFTKRTQPMFWVGLFSYNSSARSVMVEFQDKMNQRAAEGGFRVGYISIDFSQSEDNFERAADLFKNERVDLIITGQSAATIIAKSNPDIPVIVAYASNMDMAQEVLEQSTGANIIFLDTESVQSSGERLGYMHEIMPEAKTVLVIRNKDGEPWANPAPMDGIQRVATRLGLNVIEKQITSRKELNKFFLEYDFSPVDAVLRYPDHFVSGNIDLFFAMLNQPRIRKPFIVSNRTELTDGGLLSYGFDVEAFGAVAANVATDLLIYRKDPASIAIVHLEKFVLGVNKDVADMFGIDIPETLINRADIVIGD